MNLTIWLYCYVAAGGAIGAVIRFFSQQMLDQTLGKSFPFGTLAVNFIGSFLIGALYIWFQQNESENQALRIFLIVGVLGGFTTFSTFSLETVLLLQNGDIVKAFANITASLLLCIAGTWLALSITKG